MSLLRDFTNGIDDAEKIWNWLINNGKLSKAGAAGVMGNMQQESAFISINLQDSSNRILGLTDIQYTDEVDSGKYSKDKFIHDSAGYGLCQWTHWSRKEKLYNLAKDGPVKYSIGSYSLQLTFLIQELKTSKLYTTLQTIDDPNEASDLVVINFERPASIIHNEPDSPPYQNTLRERRAHSVNLYNTFSGLTAVLAPTVTVTPAQESVIDGKTFTLKYGVDKSYYDNIGTYVAASRYHQSETVYTKENEDKAKKTVEQSKSFLVYPALVETPYIVVTIGNYTFGSYSKLSNGAVQYPNFIEGLTVTKINGDVNRYLIKLKYQIAAGEDPNFIDKVLGSVSNSRTLKISYGDMASPSFIYKNESALITKVTTNIDFNSSSVTYQISCTSNSVTIKSNKFTFVQRTEKVSNIIRSMLSTDKYKFNTAFPGMKKALALSKEQLIPSDDQEVFIESKNMIDPLSYLNYIVSCMTPSIDKKDSLTKSAKYYLVICDDENNEYGGTYFKIVKVNAYGQTSDSKNNLTASSTIQVPDSYDAYTVDIGYPGNSLVTNFTVNNDSEWAILYNFADKANQSNYVYTIDNSGKLDSTYSLSLTTSSEKYRTTTALKNWWTSVTQFPVEASLTIKGLIRPAILMNYVRINALFYGQRHISSGLYIITKQVDTIDKAGYRTNLTLLRIGEDNF